LIVASSSVLPVPPGPPRAAAIRFSGDWWHPWTAGTLPPVRVPSADLRLADLGLPLLLLHGRHDTTFPAALATQTAAVNPPLAP
jgi:pimeloyl-ACP methyl ester carboxylesterase